MSLDAWTARLVDHFGELAEQRLGQEQGVFALEHGLSPEETQDLEHDLRAAASAGGISDRHWLPWVAYAAERGYEYSGDEYWQSFEEKTPRWRADGERAWIRDWFQKFAQEYKGFKPSGAWADHFTIISWPITHAILPCDLQRYLARVLYQIRHSFNSLVLRDAAALGELIQARSWEGSSRFRHLAQHTRLMGQIATALLRPEDNDSHCRILPATLRRIGEDLELERRARHWLGHARASAKARLELRGLRRSGSREVELLTSEGLPQKFIEELGMEPRLLLRPHQDGVWQVFLEFPDLSHVRARFPAIGDLLSDSRCHVAGSVGSPVPRGGFLYGPNCVRLARWPKPGEHLLQFERTSAETAWVQSVESLLRPGPKWLAKISADGLARETRGPTCRPGSSYIVCSISSLGNLPFSKNIKLSCSGIKAARMDLPDVLDSTVARSLRQAGFVTARRLELWPAGVPAASWDDEGYGEWITSQPIYIGVRADHDIHRLEVECVSPGGETVTIEPRPGEVSFFSLPSDSAGVQHIRLLSHSEGSAAPEVGELTVKVRDPREQSLYARSGAPVWIEKRPSTPTMEQLWEGDAHVLVHGPPGVEIRLTLSLLDRDAATSFRGSLDSPISLPLKAEGWSEILASFRRESRAQRYYDAARALCVSINAGLFGCDRLIFERETSPLRWSVTAKRLQLLDDTGRPEDLQVWRSDFASPAVNEEIPPEVVVAGMEVPPQGGLFLAIAKDLRRGLVAAPSEPLKGFHELRANPAIDLPARSVAGLHSMIDVAARWVSARLPGDPLSAIWRDEVLVRVLQRIFGLIGGERWEQGEIGFDRKEIALRILARLVAKDAIGERFAGSLLEAVPEMARASTPVRVAMYCKIAMESLAFPPAKELAIQELLEFCLRLASLAHGLQGWGGARRDAVADWLLQNPSAARGARFVVLGVDRLLGTSDARLGRPHSEWEW